VRLRRSPVLFWTATGAVALTTGLTVSGLTGRAAARAAELGGLQEVAVAARPVAAGTALTPADVAVRRLPVALLPDSPRARSARGRVALVDLAEGEVLLAARLGPEGVSGAAALLPPGARALAVPADGAGLPLGIGDRVDVLATFDTVEPGADPTVTVARAAVVLATTDDAVTIAVTPQETPRLAFALARGIVALALTSPATTEPRRELGRNTGTEAASSAVRP